jgi:ribosome-interacting GTPase 1
VFRLWAWQYSLTEDQCHSIHKTIVEQFKHAIVYGKSVKHQPQRVGLAHELADEDIGMYLGFR